MNGIFNMDMTDVMRLTRGGHLQEATRLLQAGLAGQKPHPAEILDAQVTIDFHRSRGDGSWALRDTPSPDLFQKSETRPGGKGLHRGRRAPGAARPISDDARFETRSVQNAAGTLAYKLYIPSRIAKPSLPLLVMLHGCTQDADDFAVGTRMNALAEEFGFLVAYPEQTSAANASRCWNWFRASDQARDRGEPSLIADATRAVVAEFAVDPARIFIAGLSAGGAAAAVMGCTYPDLYAGVGVHSGLACGAASDMPSAFAAMQGGSKRHGGIKSRVRTIVFHGRNDHTVNPRNADAVADQAKGRSASETIEEGLSPDATRFTRTVRRDEGGTTVGEIWMIDGAAHAWSGGDPAGSYVSARGPDASREMLRFFAIGA